MVSTAAFDARRVDVDDAHPGTLGGEPERGREPDAGRSSGDGGTLAGESAAHAWSLLVAAASSSRLGSGTEKPGLGKSMEKWR